MLHPSIKTDLQGWEGLGQKCSLCVPRGMLGSELVLGEYPWAGLANDMTKSMNQFPSSGLNLGHFKIDPDRPIKNASAFPGPLCNISTLYLSSLERRNPAERWSVGRR